MNVINSGPLECVHKTLLFSSIYKLSPIRKEITVYDLLSLKKCRMLPNIIYYPFIQILHFKNLYFIMEVKTQINYLSWFSVSLSLN